MSVNAIDLAGVTKRYGAHVVLDGIDLHVAPGKRLGLIGPAASGKSVICKLVAGLEQPDAGSITTLGESVVGRAEAELGDIRKRIGMLFQNYALFDFLTVAQNVAFPLERRGGMTADEIGKHVADRIRAVGLAGSEG